MNLVPFSQNLDKLIRRAGKIPQQVAEEAGIPQPTLSRYLKEQRSPSIEYVVKLAVYFNVSVDSLLGLDTGEKDACLQHKLVAESIDIARLYQDASPDDRAVVQAVLRKYKKVE